MDITRSTGSNREWASPGQGLGLEIDRQPLGDQTGLLGIVDRRAGHVEAEQDEIVIGTGGIEIVAIGGDHLGGVRRGNFGPGPVVSKLVDRSAMLEQRAVDSVRAAKVQRMDRCRPLAPQQPDDAFEDRLGELGNPVVQLAEFPEIGARIGFTVDGVHVRLGFSGLIDDDRLRHWVFPF